MYFRLRRKETVHDQAQMSGILDQAVERFKERDAEEQEAVKTLLVNFRNMYGFLSQVIPLSGFVHLFAISADEASEARYGAGLSPGRRGGVAVLPAAKD